MSTIGAVALWGPVAQSAPRVPVVEHVVDQRRARLTRRGRLVRALMMVLLVAAVGMLGVQQLSSAPARAASEVTAPVSTVTITVEQGDSLWAIARRVAPGVDPREVIYQMRELNGMRSNVIRPGQVLLVPGSH